MLEWIEKCSLFLSAGDANEYRKNEASILNFHNQLRNWATKRNEIELLLYQFEFGKDDLQNFAGSKCELQINLERYLFFIATFYEDGQPLWSDVFHYQTTFIRFFFLWKFPVLKGRRRQKRTPSELKIAPQTVLSKKKITSTIFWDSQS